MKTYWEAFLFSSCVHCSAFPVYKGTTLCQSCWGRLALLKVVQPLIYELEDIKVYSLFFWIPDQSDLLSHFLLSLKGEGGRRSWQILASWFLMIYDHLGLDVLGGLCLHNIPHSDLKIRRSAVLVPVPTRPRNRPHHAYLWAKALGQAWQIHTLNLLQVEGDRRTQQKNKENRQDRQDVKFSLLSRQKKLSSPCISQKHIILVDDIVTTGATVRACWKALNQPKDFAVWTLAVRTKNNEGLLSKLAS